MLKPGSVAIYARISSDPDGTALGVARQLQDCRKLAATLGWTLGDEYVDNDVSAYSGAARPEYERMLADLQDHVRDGVICYHADRLTRRPMELEHFLSVLNDAGVEHVQFVSGGEINPTNGDNLLMLRMQAAFAANESAAKSRRVKRKHDELAAAGRPNGGERPFGFEPDRVTIRESEAAVIREMAERYLAGESFRSLATWLQDAGVKTSRGREWRVTTVSLLLSQARIAGLREHRGEIVGAAAWQPIIPRETWERVCARKASRWVARERSPRSYLLTGLGRCGKCDARLSSAMKQGTRKYRCLSGPERGGCGGIAVVAEPLEILVAESVLYRLDTPEMANALAGQHARDERTSALSESAAADRAQLDDLARAYAVKDLSMHEWRIARDVIQTRLEATERELSRLSRNGTLMAAVGNGAALRSGWDDLNLGRQQAIVAAIVDHVAIGPATPGVQHFDPSRVAISWRL